MTATPEAQPGAPADVGELVKRLRAHKPYNQFTDGPLVLEAATALQSLQAERDEEHARTDRWQDRWEDENERALAAEARALAAEAEADRRVAEEREACAKLAEDIAMDHCGDYVGFRISEAIRGR